MFDSKLLGFLFYSASYFVKGGVPMKSAIPIMQYHLIPAFFLSCLSPCGEVLFTLSTLSTSAAVLWRYSLGCLEIESLTEWV
jgi:hypothetical protein